NSFSYSLPAASVCHFVLQTDVVSVEEENPLLQNYYLTAYPNPFNPSCRIEYNVPVHSNSYINIYSVNGELVKSYNELSGAGNLIWDGSNRNGQKVSSGVYFATLNSNGEILSTQKLVLMK
ncbi:MAG TPA: T9SS type A sorting domain-containing protein, partial [Ignavibacteriaceae bacterium]|nr:T9SS type A sorting domain-containing protein [Ignavibacteriaceae bacterium]